MRRGDRARRIAIEARTERCIHSKSSWALCSDCVRSCPSAAIQQPRVSSAPTLDSKRCFGCGTCLTSCANDAFASTGFNEKKVASAVAGYARVRLRCFLPYGELNSISSSIPSYQLSTCLSALTPGMLFQTALDHEVVLATAHCASCAFNRTAGRQMQRNIRTAQLLLREWGREGNLLTADSSRSPRAHESLQEAHGPKPSPAQPAEQSADRAAASDALSATAPVAAAPPASTETKVHKLFSRPFKPMQQTERRTETKLGLVPQETSRWRDDVEAVWQKLPGRPSGAAYLWPAQRIDAARCRACGICRQLCPTGAIRQRFEDGSFVYVFKPGSCIDCNLCARSCAQHAISHAHAHDAKPFEERVCFTAPARACPRCGAPIIGDYAVNGYCLNCAAELGYDIHSGARSAKGPNQPPL